MPNVNSGGTPPLLPPTQLWGSRQAPLKPAAPQPAPGVSSQPATALPSLPPIGRSMPLISFSGGLPSLTGPTQSASIAPISGQTIASQTRGAQPGLGSQLTQFRNLIKSADDKLLDYYNVKLLKNPNGQITGYLLNGQNVSAADIQRHLLPTSGILHQQITDLKKEIDQTFQNFRAQVQLQFPALAASEQTAVQIQLQAVQVVYESFGNRLSQLDGLIK